MVLRRRIAIAAPLCLLAILTASADGAITRNNVLLVVNTNSTDSTAIRDAYVAKYPGVRVWEYAGSTAVSIERTTFESELRAPLDTYLRSTPSGETQALYKTIRVLVLTKGVPRRVYDIDGQTIGDSVSQMVTQYNNDCFDAASVDSELTMLHQALNAGDEPEPTGLPKNYANNYVVNPYYGSTSRIDAYSRTYATTAKSLTFVSTGWQNASGSTSLRLTAGDIYLVTRLTGYTAAEAIAALGRSGTIYVDRHAVAMVFDGDVAHAYDSGDYAQISTTLTNERFLSTHDATSVFLTSADRPVLGYAGYGVNHTVSPPSSPAGVYILDALDFTLAPGAVFNTYESFNGRNSETVSPHDAHGQVADWIRIGGTLGFGHVFEPFSGAVARNSTIYDRMLLKGWTFAEAAYASLPLISWENIVVGDPLTTLVLLPDVVQWQIVCDHGTAGQIATTVTDGYIEPRSQGICKLACTLSKAVNSATLTSTAVTVVGQRTGDQTSLLKSLTLDGTGKVLAIEFLTALPDVDTYTVTITPELTDTSGYSFTGPTVLHIGALAGDANGSGAVTATDMLVVRSLIGETLTTDNARYDLSGSGAIAAGDILEVRAHIGMSLP